MLELQVLLTHASRSYRANYGIFFASAQSFPFADHTCYLLHLNVCFYYGQEINVFVHNLTKYLYYKEHSYNLTIKWS